MFSRHSRWTLGCNEADNTGSGQVSVLLVLWYLVNLVEMRRCKWCNK